MYRSVQKLLLYTHYKHNIHVFIAYRVQVYKEYHYVRVIDDASSKSQQCLFNEHIARDAHVVTDEWNGNLPIMKLYPNMERRKSEEGNNFPDLHIHIMNIKGWLRGIHHHCTKERLQGYLDEYHFRYNRRNSMDSIFDMLLKRMVLYKPVRL